MAVRRITKEARHDGQKPLAQHSETICGLNASILPAVVLSSVTWYLLRYIVQPLFRPDEYYIDEEFHVPQAQHYCRAAFNKVSRFFSYAFRYNCQIVYFSNDTFCVLSRTIELCRIGLFKKTTNLDAILVLIPINYYCLLYRCIMFMQNKLMEKVCIVKNIDVLNMAKL